MSYTTDEAVEARALGKWAARDGEGLEANPYTGGCGLDKAWVVGWKWETKLLEEKADG